ncbi:MAG: hypothetical protein HYZ65_12215 [Burkholderiales bacterium]|nr:hypothetical protein [Burkholderiales bacterium]
MLNESLMNTKVLAASGKSTQAELLVSAVLHLMSHYTVNSGQGNDQHACLKLASVIERHLKALADLPDLAPVLRATCQQLSEQWSGLVERRMPPQGRLLRLARRVAGAA